MYRLVLGHRVSRKGYRPDNIGAKTGENTVCYLNDIAGFLAQVLHLGMLQKWVVIRGRAAKPCKFTQPLFNR